MKIKKSKLLVIPIMGGIMGGVLSFSTLPITAQDTSSKIVAEQSETNTSAIGAAFAVGSVLYGMAERAVAEWAVNKWFGNNNQEANYPPNALD